MELKINEVMLPQEITFNYDELKAELTEKVAKYETLVYTEDQLKDAKADRAALNKLKTALKDERIRRKKEYLKPFEDFENKVNEIIDIIDKPVTMIDKQVKEFDEKRKADKRIEIGSYWETTEHPEWITLARLFDERWLNTGYSMRQIKDDITGWLNRINSELETLATLTEFAYEATEEYKRTLDINRAVAEGKRLADLQKRKAEIEAQKKADAMAEMHKADEALANTPMDAYMTPPTAPANEGSWIKFAARLTVEQALELKRFFKAKNIEYKAI